MHFLSGALFVTLQESDTGIPVFQVPNDNYRYTCVLDRTGAIKSFLPILTDELHFLPHIGHKDTFGLGDVFGLLLVRHQGRLRRIDTGDAVEVDAALLEFGDASYVSLQVLRSVTRFNPTYETRTRRVISEVAEGFPLSLANRRKFVAAELTLLTYGRTLWDWIDDAEPKTESASDIFARYKDLGKRQLETIIAAHPSANKHWPYVFSVYAQLFGCDDFLYQNGKDYISQMMFDQDPFAIIEIEVLQAIIDFQLQRVAKPASAGAERYVFDDELRAILDELLLSEAFLAIIGAYRPIIDLVATAVRVSSNAVNSAIELLSVVNRARYQIPTMAHWSIGHRVEMTLRDLNDAELRDFVLKAEPLAMFTDDDEFRKLVRNVISSKPKTMQIWAAVKRICGFHETY